MKRRILAAAVVCLACFAALITALAVYIGTDHAKNLLVGQVNARIPGTLHVDRMRLALTDTAITLDGITLRDPGGNTCLNVRQLTLGLRLRSLMDKVLEITQLTIDTPRLDINRNNRKEINLFAALYHREQAPGEAQPSKKTPGAIPLAAGIDLFRITNLTAAFFDQATGQEFGPIHIAEFTASASFDPKGTLLFSLDLLSNLCDMNASGTANSMFLEPKLDISLEAAARLNSISRISNRIPKIAGTVNFSLESRGTLANPSADFQITGQDLAAGDHIREGEIFIFARLADRVLTIEESRAAMMENRVMFSGATDLTDLFPNGFLSPAGNPDNLRYDLSLSQPDGRLDHFSQWIDNVSGEYALTAGIEGKGIDPDTLSAGFKATLSLRDVLLKPGETSIPDSDAVISGNIENGAFTIDRLSLDTRGLQASLAGSCDLLEQTVSATMNIETQDLSNVAPGFIHVPISGSANGSIRLTGPVRQPDIEAVINGINLDINGIAIQAVDMKADITPDISAGIVQATITAKGRGMNLENTQFSDISPPPGPQAGSLMDFDLETGLTYTMGTRPDVNALDDMTIPFKKIHADINLEDKTLDVSLDGMMNLEASLDTETSRYDARISFTRSDLEPILAAAGIRGLQASLHGWIHSSGALPIVLQDSYAAAIETARGHLAIDADVGGTITRPQFKAGMEFMDVAVSLEEPEIELSDLNGKITASPEKISIQGLVARIDQKSISLAADLAITFSPPVSGLEKIRVADPFPIPFTHVLSEVDLDTHRVRLSIDDTIDLEADFDLDKLHHDFDLAFNKTPLAPFLEAIGIRGQGGAITGHISTSGHTDIQLPLAAVEAASAASGRITIDAGLKGTLRDPDITATVQLTDAAYPLPMDGLLISGINGRIHASNNLIRIEDLAAILGGGRLSLSGNVDLEDFMPIRGDILLTGQNITIESEDTAALTFDTDLAFSGTWEDAAISGNILMHQGEFYKDIHFDPVAALTRRQPAASKPADGRKEAAGRDALLPRASVNINVTHKAPFIVDNNLAFILVEPNLGITGTLAHPVITGRAVITEGTVVYQKKSFEIEKGVIEFNNPYKTDPEITLNATTRIRNWTIYMDISGTMNNLDFKLHSDPELTHEDIVSLLIMGKTVREIGGKSTSAAGMIADKASGMLGESVESATPLDTFKLGYDESSDQEPGVSVTMGKKLSDRMELVYSMKRNDNEETVHTSAVEYRMLEHVVLKVINDSRGDFGTQVTFKLEFR